MAWFYSQQDGREMYQSMIDAIDSQGEIGTDLTSVRHLMPKYICDLKPETILEIGCASGRLYRQLRQYGYQGNYSGVEVADYLIQQNRHKHPQVNWQCGIDAVYLASKKEVDYWATQKGFQVEYPCGTKGEFAEQAFIVIYKTSI
ncbi:MAG: class I SAM-dependent methyltransferase, partial [Dolichospermum sp.]